MDEERYIDWFAVVEAVANGRVTGHLCPICHQGTLEASVDGVWVRVACPDCGEGFEGALGHGRDDALYAEAAAMEQRRAQAAREASAQADLEAQAPAAEAGALVIQTAGEGAEAPPAPPQPARPQRDFEPWAWSLPNANGDDLDGLAAWMDALTAVHNGRRTGLRCPFCSEVLEGISVRDPYIRLHCVVCGETFEGQVR